MTDWKNEAAAIMAAIEKLNEKVEACQGLCEAVLEEVVPLGLALDAISAAENK